MKRWSHRHQLRLINEISVTPLLDVVLVLMLVFMLTAPLLNDGTKVVRMYGRWCDAGEPAIEGHFN
jgi:biopolymer transport protein ExbD